MRSRSPVSRSALTAALLALLLGGACERGERPDEGPPESIHDLRWKHRVQAAEAYLAPFKRELRAALEAGLAGGDPHEALQACRVRAPRIAADARHPGLSLGRSSHRLRNPANAPEPWLAELLDDLRQRPRQAHSRRLTDLPDGGVGYAEPIFMQPMCSICHGTQVEPRLLAAIREAYPGDAATGFEPGELRGVFWVRFSPEWVPPAQAP